jgi:hypothetical protein
MVWTLDVTVSSGELSPGLEFGDPEGVQAQTAKAVE